MNRLLASLIALVLLVSPVAKVMASCCPQMAEQSMAMPAAQADMPPCHGEMSTVSAAPVESMGSDGLMGDCGHAASCCDAVAALVIDFPLPLAAVAPEVRAPQPESAAQAKRPENLFRPPSTC